MSRAPRRTASASRSTGPAEGEEGEHEWHSRPAAGQLAQPSSSARTVQTQHRSSGATRCTVSFSGKRVVQRPGRNRPCIMHVSQQEQVHHQHHTTPLPPTHLTTHRARADEPLELRHQQGAVPGSNHCRAGRQASSAYWQTGVSTYCFENKNGRRSKTADHDCTAAPCARQPTAIRVPSPPRTCAQASPKEPFPRLLGRQLDEGGAAKEEACRSRQERPQYPVRTAPGDKESTIPANIPNIPRCNNTACPHPTTPNQPQPHPPAR